jgi:hypothetical protein
MLSSVLKSPTAVRVNIEIMRTFVRLRRLMATPGELVEQITKLAETVQLHDHEIEPSREGGLVFTHNKTRTNNYSPRSFARICSKRAANSFSNPRSTGR